MRRGSDRQIAGRSRKVIYLQKFKLANGHMERVGGALLEVMNVAKKRVQRKAKSGSERHANHLPH
jgi:hypothetical protein